ncbi:MAG TPA: hypothetical protein ENN66_05130 [Proteobacteria bacterium]|nr:hypothetical protein [Pseudomonadota bacterium]
MTFSCRPSPVRTPLTP